MTWESSYDKKIHASQVVMDASGSIAAGSVKDALASLDTSKGTPYTHPSGDGNLHVPANSTTNAGKVLVASSSAGSYSWIEHTMTIPFCMASPGTDELSPKYVMKEAATATYVDVQYNTAPSSGITIKLYNNVSTEIASFSSTASGTNDMTDAALAIGDTLNAKVSGAANGAKGVNIQVKLVRT